MMAVRLVGSPAVAFGTLLGQGAVFVIADDGSLYEVLQTAGGWSAWINRGTPRGVRLLPSPAVSWANFIDLFALNPVAIGSDNRPYSLPQHDGGNSWSAIDDASLAPSPTALQSFSGLQFVCAVGTDKTLRSFGFPGPNGWTSYPGRAVQPSPCAAVGLVTVGKAVEHRLELFAVGTDSALWHMANGGGHSERRVVALVLSRYAAGRRPIRKCAGGRGERGRAS